MAGNWDRDEDRGGSNQWRGGVGRERSSSIFDEGDRGEPWGAGDWAGSYDRGNAGPGGGEGRGQSHYGSEHGFGGFQGDYSGGAGQGGFGGEGDYRGGGQNFSGGGAQGGSGGRTGFGQDDHYRSWRARQIEQMDRDYEEYCRDRQQSFQVDFASWRQNRQAQGGSGAGASESTGLSGTTGLMTGSGGTTGGGDESGPETGSIAPSKAGAGETNGEAKTRSKSATS